ncbi:MAG: FlgT C-terminal domain-containing protein [Armatimonadota bacterium]|nr:hypothetical protein [Armatimonadota bacterium]MCX7776944.1 hypothetical protein [Armatimonadota bacterium]MDW8024778.1 FlgT C-terminal domain-containing protein [Armatimonadota bacterium]
MCRKMTIALSCLLFLSSVSTAQLRRAFLPKRPALEFLKGDVVVISNSVTLYNEFRTKLPEAAQATFVNLSELPKQIAEIRGAAKHVVFIIDWTKEPFPVEHRELLPYDIRLIRDMDVVLAGDVNQIERKPYVRLLISAPSHNSACEAIERLSELEVREIADLKMQRIWQVPLLVVVTNAGEETIAIFGERIKADFTWVTLDKLPKVERLLATETEVYILTGEQPIPRAIKEKLPYPIDVLRQNQSVLVRASKGGKYYRILFYSPNAHFLNHLVSLYEHIEEIPSEPRLILHLDLSHVKRLLLFPFSDAPAIRPYVMQFGEQVVDAVKKAGLVEELLIANPQMFEDAVAWDTYRSGNIPTEVAKQLCEKHGCDAILAGHIAGVDAISITSQGLTSRPSPAADRRVWQIKTERQQRVSLFVEARLFDGRTGRLIWSSRFEGTGISKQPIYTSMPIESREPPQVQPEQIERQVLDTSLYRTAASDAIVQLVRALRGEMIWAARPRITPAITLIQPAPPIAREGQVGAVEDKFVYIDIGKDAGIKVGDEFTVIRRVRFQTARGERIIEEPVGMIRAIEVMQDMAKAVIIEVEEGMQIKPQDIVRLRIPPPEVTKQKTKEEQGVKQPKETREQAQEQQGDVNKRAEEKQPEEKGE